MFLINKDYMDCIHSTNWPLKCICRKMPSRHKMLSINSHKDRAQLTSTYGRLQNTAIERKRFEPGLLLLLLLLSCPPLPLSTCVAYKVEGLLLRRCSPLSRLGGGVLVIGKHLPAGDAQGKATQWD